MDLPIDEYFRYHPPQTEERKSKHNLVNDTALYFAKVIQDCVLDEDCKKMAFFAVQQARMFANQGITIDELRGGEMKPQEDVSVFTSLVLKSGEVLKVPSGEVEDYILKYWGDLQVEKLDDASLDGKADYREG